MAVAAVMRKANWIGLVAAGLILTADVAQALMVVEDFEFYTTDTLALNAGGSGFLGAWGANGAVQLTNTLNLTYSAGGYAVTSLGTGAACARGSQGYMNIRSLAAPIPGTGEGRTVWFSTLLRPTATSRLGCHFNSTSVSRTNAVAGLIVVGTQVRKVDDGVMSDDLLPLTANTTHLILGSVLLKDTGDSTVSYWFDPADLTATNTLGEAAVTFGADFGGSISNIGMEAYSGASGMMDALRASDGNGDAGQAFLDVTRATPQALFGPVAFAALEELTNSFALVDDARASDWTAANDGNHGDGGYLKARTGLGHHVYVIDRDGAIGGGNDVFGDCTIDFDIRGGSCGMFFLGTGTTLQTPKHWIFVAPAGLGDDLRAYYNRNMVTGTGGTIKTNEVYTLDASTWRHVRVDVRRVNDYTIVEARVRVWANASDFRGAPVHDCTFTYTAATSHKVDGEIGFSAYCKTTDPVAYGELDNLAVYRLGGAPDWFIPKGTLIRVK